MYFVYILENKKDKGWYIGFTGDLEKRVGYHNKNLGGVYTKTRSGNWESIYWEAYKDKKDALGREKFLKSGAGRGYLKKQLANYLSKI